MNDRTLFIKPAFEDIGLQIGACLQLSRHAGETPHTVFCTLVGYVPGEYILVRLPPGQGTAANLYEGEIVAGRVFSEASLYGFHSQVEAVSFTPYSCVHLSYPHDVQANRFRRQVRVNVDLPAQVSFDPCEPAMNAIATLTDLSAGGARLLSHLPLGEIGSELHCCFELHTCSSERDCDLRLQCRIRNISPRTMRNEKGDMQWAHGVQFIGLTANEHALLQNFVAERLLASRNIVL